MTDESSPTRTPPHKVKWTLRRATVLCAAGGFLDGYDLLIMGGALLVMVPEFHLTGAQTGVITSIPFVGMVVGALGVGWLTDRIGRRKVYLIDIIVFFVAAVLLAFVQDVWQFILLRFIVGMAIGMDMPTGSSMLAEFAPARLRGALTAMINTVWLFGGFVAALVGYALYQTTGDSAWRWMFLSAAVPALLIAVFRHTLPETPYWLRAAGKEQDAAAVEGHMSMRDSEAVRSSAGFRAREVFQPQNFKRVAFFTVYWMVQAFMGGAPFIYTALIFNKLLKFSGASALLLNASLFVLYIAFSLLCQFVVLDRAGRKALAVVSLGMAAVAAIAVGLLEHTVVPLVVSFAIYALAVQMSTIPFWPWSVEQLPTRIRATGQSIGSAGGKFGQYFGILLFTPAFVSSIGWTSFFVLEAVVLGLLTAFVVVFGKETKGTQLSTLEPQAHPSSNQPH
ncbi:MAG: MFS transporter [Nocardioidaceae bacterium]